MTNHFGEILQDIDERQNPMDDDDDDDNLIDDDDPIDDEMWEGVDSSDDDDGDDVYDDDNESDSDSGLDNWEEMDDFENIEDVVARQEAAARDEDGELDEVEPEEAAIPLWARGVFELEEEFDEWNGELRETLEAQADIDRANRREAVLEEYRLEGNDEVCPRLMLLSVRVRCLSRATMTHAPT